MSMGVHHPYHLDLCADDEDPFQLIIRPGWDAPHVRCFPRTFCAWPCLLRQVGTVLGSPYDCVVARLAYANPGSRQSYSPKPWKKCSSQLLYLNTSSTTFHGIVLGKTVNPSAKSTSKLFSVKKGT